jgi:hypothetical protein
MWLTTKNQSSRISVALLAFSRIPMKFGYFYIPEFFAQYTPALLISFPVIGTNRKVKSGLR